MFVAYTASAIFIFVSMLGFLPPTFGGVGERLDPQQHAPLVEGEVLGKNMLAYHKQAVNWVNRNRTFRGIVQEASIDIGRLGPNGPLGTWVTLVEDDSSGGGINIFTYSTEVNPATTAAALAGGLLQANGFAMGTGIVNENYELQELRNLSVPADLLNPTGARESLTRTVPITVPVEISPGTVVQFTRL